MKMKSALKMMIDVAMTVGLLMLMAYSMIGEAAHEWIGCGMLLLFLVHHGLNIRWFRNLFHGRYTVFRTTRTILVVLLLGCMAGSAVSGVVLSRYVFRNLPVMGGSAWARSVHMICAYWGFILMSLHIIKQTGLLLKSRLFIAYVVWG